MSTTYSHHAIKKRLRKQDTRSKTQSANSAATTTTSTSDTTSSTGANAQKASLFVKTFDPVSGTCLRVRVDKANQLSRVWAALGPRGVEVASKPVRGAASVMSNDKRVASADDMAAEDGEDSKQQSGTVTPQVQKEQPVSVPASGKSGKKKNKKR